MSRTKADREFDWAAGRELERKDAEIERLRNAAAVVCRFDWSGNDEDAVAAIEHLRRVVEKSRA